MSHRLLVWLLAVALAGVPAAQRAVFAADSHAPKSASRHAMNGNDRAADKAVQELELAAQRLRDATHAMARAPAGKARNDAIREADRALAQTQSAILSLPPDMLVAAGSEGDYSKAMDRTQQAAQDLRDAAHALATTPAGERRNEAMKRINKALLETQQTMIDAYMASSR